MRWVVDSEDTVHAPYCAAVGPQFLPYVTWPTDGDAMHEWLSKPDSQGGMIMSRHDGPARVKPCALCIPGGVR